MITITKVTKRFGRHTAVDDVSLAIMPGEGLALWGANGAGKTTLIRCVLGLLRFQGTIAVGGHDVLRRGKSARMLIGYVPQELSFYDELLVDTAVRFFARLKGVDRASPDAVLAGVGLGGHGGKRVRDLSGGMKQRLALAIALLGDPPVLVLDEVTASLDAVGREEFIGLLKQLTGSGRTLLFASHRLEEVNSLADRVAVLEQGKVVRIESTQLFTASSSHTAAIHIHVRAGLREQALRTLEAGGFAARLNGVGLVVPVSPNHKAAPFRLLADARVPVDDFEFVSLCGYPAPMAHHDDEKQQGRQP